MAAREAPAKRGSRRSGLRTQILGTGTYAPEKVLTNQDLEKIVQTSDRWIYERTGIRKRHVGGPGEATSDMAVRAATRALEMARTRADELDLIIVATVTPDMPMPSSAVSVQQKLGAKKAFAFDISAACAGSLYALSVADQYVRTGTARRVLVAGADMLTRIVDWQDRNTCVLFGDAAGAIVLGPTEDPERGILSTHLHSDGAYVDLLCIRGGGSLRPLDAEVLAEKANKVSMKGREVYKFAVRALADSVEEALDANGMSAAQVDHVLAHQANARIIDAVLERLEIPREKCWLNIDRYGNTSSASLPITLDEANRAGKLARGEVIAMMAIGAGMVWGSGLVRW